LVNILILPPCINEFIGPGVLSLYATTSSMLDASNAHIPFGADIYIGVYRTSKILTRVFALGIGFGESFLYFGFFVSLRGFPFWRGVCL
jgi:hypothetical protein